MVTAANYFSLPASNTNLVTELGRFLLLRAINELYNLGNSFFVSSTMLLCSALDFKDQKQT